ncbi:MAG TPA: AmmeMemoRadiSam system protein B [Thermodesulfobacteriota bacterium]|nr:AmmeMemoRadiSam system protein B [Thermodesulfobacteriota bacterium]
MIEYPKLRYVEAIPSQENGKKVVYLRDPQNPGGNVLAVSPGTVIALSLFDGEKSIGDICGILSQRFGGSVERGDIENLVSKLDEALFLDSPRYREHRSGVEREFRESEVREAGFSGLSYPSSAAELGEWFGRFLRETGGARENGGRGKLKGIISPHIDYSRGGVSYARAYEILPESGADVFIIFGTSHYGQVDNPFILTRKNFRTPLGEAKTNAEIIERLEGACGWDLFEGELSHKTEHSIEFQVAFLQYVLGGKRDFTIVPVLCTSFHRMVTEGSSPLEDGRVSKFLGEMKEIISGLGDRAFIIAGADMAHVGLKFGDNDRVNDETLGVIRERDLASLAFGEKIDAEGFYRSIESEKDWRKICGLSPIYAALSTIETKSGVLLDYDQALEPDTGSVVSYASMGFYL